MKFRHVVSPTLRRLKARAKRHGLQIHRDCHGNFILVDRETAGIATYPATLTLAEVENWIDDLDTQCVD